MSPSRRPTHPEFVARCGRFFAFHWAFQNKTDARIYTIGIFGKNRGGSDDTFEATRLLKQIATEDGGEFRVAFVEEAAPQN